MRSMQIVKDLTSKDVKPSLAPLPKAKELKASPKGLFKALRGLTKRLLAQSRLGDFWPNFWRNLSGFLPERFLWKKSLRRVLRRNPSEISLRNLSGKLSEISQRNLSEISPENFPEKSLEDFSWEIFRRNLERFLPRDFSGKVSGDFRRNPSRFPEKSLDLSMRFLRRELSGRFF